MPTPARWLRLLPVLAVTLALVTLALAFLPVYATPPDDPSVSTEAGAPTGVDAPAQRASGPANASPIALTSDNRLLVVCNPDNDSITVFDVQADRNRKLAEIRVGKEPRSVAIHPNNRLALVTNQASGTVSAVDLRQLRRTQDVRVGTEPYGVVFTPNGAEAWITNAGSGDISILQVTSSAAQAKAPLAPATTVTLNEAAKTDAVHATENASLRGVAVTNLNRQDGVEFVYVTQFLSDLASGGQQMSDTGKNGRVFVLSTATRNVVARINLQPHDTGFDADRTAFGGSNATPTQAFPNQLQWITLKGTRAYLPNTAAAPEAPVKFDVDTQAFLGVIDTATNTELGAFNLNLNLAVKQQTATPKLFLAVPWAVAFERASNDGYVVSAASNVLAKVALDGQGAPSAVFDTASNGTRVREIAVGKNPQGLVIASDDRRAYVMNYVSRDVSVIDLTQTPEREIARLAAAALPRAGTLEDRVQIGKELFNTSVGVFDQTDPATGQAVRGRMSNNGWQGCVSCHPSGLTDGVVWQFPAGPRKSIPLNTSFNPHNPDEARLLNYSAIFDEINDFELNIRGVSGGKGVIITDTVGVADPTAPHPTVRAFDPANFGRQQLTVRGVKALDAVTEYVRRGIRSPLSPENPNDATVQQGRTLFTVANCQSCHGGTFWTSSVRDFTPPPNANEIATGQAPEPALQFIPSVLRLVGTFDPNNPVEHTAANQTQRPLGAQGFNPPSLIGGYALGPYTHNGGCETLDCVLNNVVHRSAGVSADVLTNAADRAAVARFLRSIDVTTRPIAPSGVALSSDPGALRVARTQSGAFAIHVDGSGPVTLQLDSATVPAGVTATLGRTSGTAPFDTTLTLAASANATNGQSFIKLCATGSGRRQCLELGLNVFGYQLSAPVAVGYAHANQNDETTFVVQAVSLGGDVPDVTLAVDGVPTGASVEFALPGGEPFTDAPAGTPFGDQPFTTLITVKTTAATPPGVYTVTVRAVGEGLQRQTNLRLQVGNGHWVYLPLAQRNPE